MDNRFKKYCFVVALVAIVGGLVCMAATDAFWGLLISVGVIPIACLFACGVIAIVEACVQSGAMRVADNRTGSSMADEPVEGLEER